MRGGPWRAVSTAGVSVRASHSSALQQPGKLTGACYVQPGNQQGLHTDGRTEGGLAAGALGGAGAVGAAGAAGAGARQAHTSTAGPSGAGPSAPAAPVSDSELVSKYSTKQELSPSKSMLDEEAPAAGDTAGSTGPGPAGTAGMAAASGIAPPGGIGRGQSSDKEPLPTSKNAGEPATWRCCTVLPLLLLYRAWPARVESCCTRSVTWPALDVHLRQAWSKGTACLTCARRVPSTS